MARDLFVYPLPSELEDAGHLVPGMRFGLLAAILVSAVSGSKAPNPQAIALDFEHLLFALKREGYTLEDILHNIYSQIDSRLPNPSILALNLKKRIHLLFITHNRASFLAGLTYLRKEMTHG